MSFETGLSVFAIFIGLMLMFFGYLIGIEKKMLIFESYNRSTMKDKEAVAILLGKYMILIGLYTLITPFLVKMFGKTMAFLYPFMLIVILRTLISGTKEYST